MIEEGEILIHKLPSVEEQRFHDVNTKLEIARFVVKACMSAKATTSVLEYTEFCKEASRYFSHDTITELLTQIKNKPKSLFEWHLEFSKENNKEIYDTSIDKLLREIIVEHYIIQKTLPSIESISMKFKTNNIGFKKELQEIKTCMKMRGFKWTRLPHTNKTIIIEDPEQCFARIKYLHSIIQFRQVGKHIIYIEEKIVGKNGLFLDTLKCQGIDVLLTYLAVSSSFGIISQNTTNIPNCRTTVFNDNYDLKTNWIINTVVPQLSTSSVFIFEDNLDSFKSYNSIPTMYSNKNDIINWLELNAIPHNSNMHSAELFELVNRSKLNFSHRNYAIDDILLSFGHKVLRRPQRAQYLNYYNQLGKKSLKTLQTMPLSDWVFAETKLAVIEKNTLEEDITVDRIIEKIFTFAKNGPITYDDIKDCDNEIDQIKMAEIVQFLES